MDPVFNISAYAYDLMCDEFPDEVEGLSLSVFSIVVASTLTAIQELGIIPSSSEADARDARLYEDAYAAGYGDGYEDCAEDYYQDGALFDMESEEPEFPFVVESAYTSGFSIGYSEGFDEGYYVGMDDCQPLSDEDSDEDEAFDYYQDGDFLDYDEDSEEEDFLGSDEGLNEDEAFDDYQDGDFLDYDQDFDGFCDEDGEEYFDYYQQEFDAEEVYGCQGDSDEDEDSLDCDEDSDEDDEDFFVWGEEGDDFWSEDEYKYVWMGDEDEDEDVDMNNLWL